MCDTWSSVLGMAKAPDIRKGYPSAGEILGPLWQGMWNLLSKGGEVTVKDFVASTGGNPDTVRTLLRQATRSGLVSARREHRAPRQCYYHIITGEKS